MQGNHGPTQTRRVVVESDAHGPLCQLRKDDETGMRQVKYDVQGGLASKVDGIKKTFEEQNTAVTVV